MAAPASAQSEIIKDILGQLMPLALSGEKPMWPPDAFALAATILKRSGAYREVANDWPPATYSTTKDWHDKIFSVAEEWRDACKADKDWPTQVDAWWEEIIRQRGLPLDAISPDKDIFVALIGIVACADQSCRGFGFYNSKRASTIDDRAITNLSSANTLCEAVNPPRVSVLPKAHNPVSGMTLRSLTHNLALWDRAEVSPSWHNILIDSVTSGINILLLPWPLVINPTAFHPAADCHNLRLPERAGLFEYDISFDPNDIDRIKALIEKAKRVTGTVDAVIFPELSMSSDSLKKLQKEIQTDLKIPLLIAGIGGINRDKLGTNSVAISVYSELRPFLQSKHHRWRLDHKQASGYGITSLPEKKDNGAWWEAIHIEERVCRFFNANEWLTFCVLVCEDLARQDPVSELVRSVGPSLVVALLLDGPQIPERWPAHYGTVLADDPRSSVLTLTSAGLVDLARSQHGGGPRSVALWKDAISRSNKQIILEPGSDGIVLNVVSEMRQEWTADGRHDNGKSGYLKLAGIYQVDAA
jgi:hypothetical protein